jgi:hypothetical protein
MNYLNLKSRFGREYRITLDDAAEDRKDPWAFQIPGRFGVVYPFGGDLLAVECDYHTKAARALAVLPGVRTHQDGDRERTFIFPADLFGRVAEIIQLRRRRRCHLSAEQRRLVGERLRAHRKAAAV